MDKDRIIKYLNNRIIYHTNNNEMFSETKIETYNEILQYIQSHDAAKENEVDTIKRVFLKYYIPHMEKAIGRKMKPPKFKKVVERNIKTKLIPDIKHEMDSYPDDYAGWDLEMFFEAFIQNLPPWWKMNAFRLDVICNHFGQILEKILINKNNGKSKSSRGDKPTVANVFAEYAEGRDAVQEQESDERV